MELHGNFEANRILGMFRDFGSFDPDVLDRRRAELIGRARVARRIGNRFALLGVISLLTMIGMPVGVTLLFVGWQLRHRGAEHVRSVERAFAEYTRPFSHFNTFENPEPGGD